MLDLFVEFGASVAHGESVQPRTKATLIGCLLVKAAGREICSIKPSVKPGQPCSAEEPNGAIQFGDDSPGDDTHSLMRDAVSSCRALRNSSSGSLPQGSFSASRLKASACSCHFCTDDCFLLPMRALCLHWAGARTGLSVTDGCPGRCGDE